MKLVITMAIAVSMGAAAVNAVELESISAADVIERTLKADIRVPAPPTPRVSGGPENRNIPEPKTAAVVNPSADRSAVGVGTFEAMQLLVLRFMGHVGWAEASMYEETGLTMESLLLKMVRTNKEARAWLEDVNKYFESSKFQSQSKQQKQQDIFDAKVLAKMTIHELGIVRRREWGLGSNGTENSLAEEKLDNAANKGSQRSTPIENARYRVQSDKLNVSGLAMKKQVSGDVQNAQISGKVSGVNCTGPSTPCYGKFHVSGSSLLLDISIDQDQDGNPEKVMRNVTVGSVAQAEVSFSVPVKAVFVEDRYSFAEHLMGLKDVEFVAITVDVSVK